MFNALLFLARTDSNLRTMAWAIDLDNGSAISNLGANFNRNKQPILPPFDPENSTDLGIGDGRMSPTQLS